MYYCLCILVFLKILQYAYRLEKVYVFSALARKGRLFFYYIKWNYLFMYRHFQLFKSC
jgi:hypothetical protein